MTSEKQIEQKLREYAKKRNILFYKWVSPGNDGAPDRIVISPTGRVVFFELKAPGKKPSVLQSVMHAVLRTHGCEVYVVDSFEMGKAILDGL